MKYIPGDVDGGGIGEPPYSLHLNNSHNDSSIQTSSSLSRANSAIPYTTGAEGGGGLGGMQTLPVPFIFSHIHRHGHLLDNKSGNNPKVFINSENFFQQENAY